MITSPAAIYTLSLHDALPISIFRANVVPTKYRSLVRSITQPALVLHGDRDRLVPVGGAVEAARADRKSTRLNSSHTVISYAVFCLKKKKTTRRPRRRTRSPLT